MTGDEIRTILSASEQEGALDPQLNMMLRGRIRPRRAHDDETP